MQITARFAGPIRTLAGRRELVLDFPGGATLRDLLRSLAETLPSDFQRQIVHPLQTGSAPLALLLVNATSLGGPADLDRPLADGDVVAFVPPMSGG